MNAEVQSFESLIYAGKFPVWVLVLSGLIVAGAIGWLAWRESRSRGRWVAGLAVLRWTALAILLWMLAEPTLSRTVRRTRMKSMVVLADASASMTASDDAMSIDSRRWALAAAGTKDAFTSLDEAA